jgi:hypothetical protein
METKDRVVIVEHSYRLLVVCSRSSQGSRVQMRSVMVV